jgi:hypothetical protein
MDGDKMIPTLMDNNFLVFVIGVLYIVAGLAMMRSIMYWPAKVLIASPLIATGILYFLYLVAPFPYIVLWLSRVSFLLAIIFVSLRYKGDRK